MAQVPCVFCSTPLPPAPTQAGLGVFSCVSCRKPNEIMLFPALLDTPDKKPPPLVFDPPAEGEAACFYNPSRRATTSCSHCGVMICDSWAAQWGSETVCLKCMDHLIEKKDSRFQASRTLWDNIALVLACVPLTVIFWIFAFFTAPAAVFLALWHWNSPRSMIPRSRFRLVLAIILGLAQIGGFVVLAGRVWFK